MHMNKERCTGKNRASFQQTSKIIIELADKYFSMKEFDLSMDLLLKQYPSNREEVKSKMIEFFEVLGNSNEHTIEYRKKLSSIMFS